MSTAFIVVSIDGNIGSGKSTLMARLRSYFGAVDNQSPTDADPDVIFVDEPVDVWSDIRDAAGVTMLEHYYIDPAKHSFAFQMMAYISRLDLLQTTINTYFARRQPLVPPLFITERSLLTDRHVFAQMLRNAGLMDPMHHQIYLRWHDTFAAAFPVHRVLYIQTPPDVCRERIQRRARAGEAQIALNYLQSCDTHHEAFIAEIKDRIPILTLDGTVDREQAGALWPAAVAAFLGVDVPATGTIAAAVADNPNGFEKYCANT